MTGTLILTEKQETTVKTVEDDDTPRKHQQENQKPRMVSWNGLQPMSVISLPWTELWMTASAYRGMRAG